MHKQRLCVAAGVCELLSDLMTTFDVILMVFRYSTCRLKELLCFLGGFFFGKMWIEWVRSSYLFYFL